MIFLPVKPGFFDLNQTKIKPTVVFRDQPKPLFFKPSHTFVDIFHLTCR